MHQDIRLRQPRSPAVVGHDSVRRYFERYFALARDPAAEVHACAGRGDRVYLEFTLGGEVGGRRVSWAAVDRFTLREGLIEERRSFFDPGILLAAVARRPAAWRPAASFLAAALRR